MNDALWIVVGVVLGVAVYVWTALALSALFRKAGEEGWQGWVPVLNHLVILRLGGYSPWLYLLVLVPGLGLVALYVLTVIACLRINRSFGFGAGMTVLAALLFAVWASVLGFGSARWIGGPAARRDTAPETPAYVPVQPMRFARSGEGGGVVPRSSGWTEDWATPPSRALDDDLEDSAVDPADRIPAPSPARSFVRPPAPPIVRDTPADPPATAPIASVPGPERDDEAADPPAPPRVDVVPLTRPMVDADPWAPPAPAEPWAPAAGLGTPDVRPDAGSDVRPEADEFPEPSEEVSAIAGAPDAGGPRSARSSVSAQSAEPDDPGLSDGPPIVRGAVPFRAAADDPGADDDVLDLTIVARRRRTPWVLVPPSGEPVDITSDVVVLGRRPSPDPQHPTAQLIPIVDETRTVSKTHARLALRGDVWFVTDLGSTNGVLFATLMGTEVEAEPGQEIEAGDRFFLGDAEVRLTRSDV